MLALILLILVLDTVDMCNSDIVLSTPYSVHHRIITKALLLADSQVPVFQGIASLEGSSFLINGWSVDIREDSLKNDFLPCVDSTTG